jgi:hypothetical protein
LRYCFRNATAIKTTAGENILVGCLILGGALALPILFIAFDNPAKIAKTNFYLLIDLS